MPMNELLPKAQAALERLDAVCDALPGSLPEALPGAPSMLPCFVRREAVFSAQLGGARLSLPAFLCREAAANGASNGATPDDLSESLSYVGALEHGLDRLREGAPLDGRLLREVCARLSPPSAASCLTDIEPLLRAARTPALTKAASVHARFSAASRSPTRGTRGTRDARGNGRIARLLAALILHHDGPRHRPLPCLSLYFKRHRRRYRELSGDAQSAAGQENWLAFFCAGVCETADDAATRAQKLAQLIERDCAHINAAGVPRSVNVVHAEFCRRPIQTTRGLANATGYSYPTAQRALQRLSEQHMVHPVDDEQRHRRAFVYTEYLGLLNEEGG